MSTPWKLPERTKSKGLHNMMTSPLNLIQSQIYDRMK